MTSMFLEKAKGKLGCERCGGAGSYVFMGSYIFCEECHGTDGVTSLWQSIASRLRGSASSIRKSRNH